MVPVVTAFKMIWSVSARKSSFWTMKNLSIISNTSSGISIKSEWRWMNFLLRSCAPILDGIFTMRRPTPRLVPWNIVHRWFTTRTNWNRADSVTTECPATSEAENSQSKKMVARLVHLHEAPLICWSMVALGRRNPEETLSSPRYVRCQDGSKSRSSCTSTSDHWYRWDSSTLVLDFLLFFAISWIFFFKFDRCSEIEKNSNENHLSSIKGNYLSVWSRKD